MRRCFALLFGIFVIYLMVMPVYALDYTAPQAPAGVEKYIPEENTSFGEGLWYVFKTTILDLRPDVQEAATSCLSILAVMLLASVVVQISKKSSNTIGLLTAVCLGLIIFKSTNSFIQLGKSTVEQLRDYGILLLPTLSAVTAAQGFTTTSATLYSGTFVFISLLSTLITKCVIPVIYIYVALCIADLAIPNEIFSNLMKFLKWLAVWSLKTVMYIFTGYMGITGVISGSVDSSALKATKLTISSAVPVVGGVISDASDTILLSAGIMKNAIGMYGLFVIISICLGPFLKIAIHYLMLKFTASICGVFSEKHMSKTLQELTGGMSLILAITGTVCLLLLISILCYVRSSG